MAHATMANATATAALLLHPKITTSQEVSDPLTVINWDSVPLAPGMLLDVLVSTNFYGVVRSGDGLSLQSMLRQKKLVALDVIPAGQSGRAIGAGFGVTVNCTGEFTAGWIVRASPTRGAVESTGVPLSALRGSTSLRWPAGAVGIALAPAFNGKVPIALFDVPMDTFDPAMTTYFFEDFLGADANAAGAGALHQFDHAWWAAGNTLGTGQALNGVVRVSGDGANIGALYLSNIGTSALATRWNSSKYPTLRVRWAGANAAAGTRRVGLFGTTPGAAGEPANGLYWRHTLGGNILAVTRQAGSEVTRDTGVAAASGTFHEGVISVWEDAANLFFDGVLFNSFPITSLPAVDLGVGAGVSTIAGGNSLDLDYVEVESRR